MEESNAVWRAPWVAAPWLLFGGLATLVAAAVAAVYAPFASLEAANAVISSATVIAGLAATLMCLRAARAMTAVGERWAWLLLALGLLASALGEVVWAYYQSILKVDVPFPSAADAFYLPFYPLAFVGVLLLVHRGSGALRRGTIILDSMVFTLGVAGLAWQTIFAPSLTGIEGGLAFALSAAYPLGDLLLVFALCSLFLSWDLRRQRSVAFVLLASFTAWVFADFAFSWLTLHNDYAGGSPIDPLWTAGYALAAAAAVLRLRAVREAAATRDSKPAKAPALGAEHTGLVRIVVPYLALPAAVAIIVLHFRDHSSGAGGRTVVVVAFSLLLLGLVMARQLLTLLENKRLHRSVEVRTSELATLNHVSTSLSRSLKTDEAVSVGLELATEAAGAAAGAVWLHRSGGGLDLVATRHLDRDARERLATLTQESPEMRRALASGCVLSLDTMAVPALADAIGELAGHDGRFTVIPLLARGAVVGALGLVSRARRAQDKSLQDLEQAIGAQLGVAVENAQRYEQARYHAERDSVTGILNHRALRQRAETECKRAQRSGEPLSIVMMDLDGFKLFNDLYGHPGGDDALRRVADLLSSSVRGADSVGRYGGDEFMAILPGTDAQAAVALCERLRSGLAEHPYRGPDAEAVPLHLSFGIATYPADAHQVNELIALADSSLYSSKQGGGDRISSPKASDDDYPAGGGMFAVLDRLVTAVDAKDHYTRHHSEEVTALALKLARQMGLSEETQRAVSVAGLLHDVGKIGVPDRILRKPGQLAEVEFEVVQQHALLSEVLMKEIPHLSEVVDAVGSHHERWDGGGYPRGLKGTEIPLLGRVLAIADAWSAMTTDRPYRAMLSPAAAREELLRHSGSQFDPALAEAFVADLDAKALAPSEEQVADPVC